MSRRVEPEDLTRTIAFIDFNIFEGAMMLSCGYTYEELLAKFGRRYPTWVKPLVDSDREFKECWGFASAHRWEDKEGKKGALLVDH
jgi:hypothetical protein